MKTSNELLELSEAFNNILEAQSTIYRGGLSRFNYTNLNIIQERIYDMMIELTEKPKT